MLQQRLLRGSFYCRMIEWPSCLACKSSFSVCLLKILCSGWYFGKHLMMMPKDFLPRFVLTFESHEGLQGCPPLKQSHIHLMHDHRIFHHCMTSSLPLNNWGQKYCQTLRYKPNPSIPQCDLIQRLILPTIQKNSLCLKLKKTHKGTANGYKYLKNWPG